LTLAERVQTEQITELEWSRELEGIRGELAVPGYWTNLEENCKQWAGEISVGPFWRRAKQELQSWKAEYRSQFGDALLIGPELPEFEGKGSKRICSKLYQKRLEKESFKEEVLPKEGPPIPKINDLVRTRIACRYVDGVEFLGNKLFDLAKEMFCDPVREKAARVEGYFAQHLNLNSDVLYRFGGTEKAKIIVEIQIATGLSTTVWETTHSIYEASREDKQSHENWQWNPKDPNFISNQLGHMIHLADGLLVQLRDAAISQKEKRS
jgi:hypothetical protein